MVVIEKSYATEVKACKNWRKQFTICVADNMEGRIEDSTSIFMVVTSCGL